MAPTLRYARREDGVALHLTDKKVLMDVVDHCPQTWFLLRDGEALLLEARCSHSAVDYRWLVELDVVERAAHATRGHAYLDELAEAIHHSAPGVRGNTSPYRYRKPDAERSQAVAEAISAWIQARHPR